MSNRTIRAVDLFCGGGGTSQGLVQACEAAGADVDLVAVNHWGPAVETHAANHPRARHHCARLEQLDPREACGWGTKRPDVLVASPECTHHSRARGAAPKNDQSRASGWDVLRWVETLQPRAVILENVVEWKDWGPLYVSGPHQGEAIQSKKGETYRGFLAILKSLGYRVEARVLNAADYGDATTRERLFVQARRGNARIQWPAPSHMEDPGTMFPSIPRWRAAREVLDLARASQSVFAREKPLADNTLRRIAEGLRRFAGPQYAEAFLVHLKGTGGARSLDRPVPSLQAGGEHVIGLAQAFLLSQDGRGAPRSVEKPSPTICTDGAVSLAQPFLVPYYGTGRATPVSVPLPTATTKDRFGLVQPVRFDVLFRMLQPDELAGAMGFPRGYSFKGNRGETVRMIGNAVAVGVARALCSAALTLEEAA